MKQDNEPIPGQVSLFDLLPQSEVDELTEEDVMEQVSQRLKLSFDRIEVNNAFQSWHQYKCKLKNVELTIDGFSTYDTMDEKDGQRMILVGFSSKKNHGGGGAPCDNVDEVVEYFKRIIDRENMTKQKEKKKGLTEEDD